MAVGDDDVAGQPRTEQISGHWGTTTGRFSQRPGAVGIGAAVGVVPDGCGAGALPVGRTTGALRAGS
jgi:hypothetical protein